MPGSSAPALWDEHQDRIALAVNTDAIQTMRLEQADCGRTIQAAARETLDVRMKRAGVIEGCVGEPPFTVLRGLPGSSRSGPPSSGPPAGSNPRAPGELPGEALHEWAARIEAILGTEPGADEPIP